MKFSLIQTSKKARTGLLELTHGKVETPVFMPVGTQGVVKALSAQELIAAGSQMMLANALHLLIRPGKEALEKAGGLHRFISWSRPILMDSGGYQVYSLAHRRSIKEQGVSFRAPADGRLLYLDPEGSIDLQQKAGVDIMMQLDECCGQPLESDLCRKAMERSLRWAKRSLDARTSDRSALFGIVQGGCFESLRSHSAKSLVLMPFDGYAHGGLGLGESAAERVRMVRYANEFLPQDKPRYLMGLGTPSDILHAIGAGIDQFDCVLPTRNGRHGWVYHPGGVLKVTKADFFSDERPLQPGCTCSACTHYSRQYIHHLFRAKEPLAARLVSLHNLHYYHLLLEGARKAIRQDCYQEYCDDALAKMAQN